MKTPIIIDNFGDLLIFDSIEKAERYIEPVDVKNNEYIAYDSEGRLLNLIVDAANRVILQSAESEPTHANELRQTLVDFLARVGVAQSWLSEASLEELVKKGLDYKSE